MPVPDPGIPREWVDAAREAIKDNIRPSANADRVWQLSGGVLRFAGCGCSMGAHTTTDGKGGAASTSTTGARRGDATVPTTPALTAGTTGRNP